MSQDEGSPNPALQILLPSLPVDGIEPSETAPSRPQRKRAPLTSVACQDCRKRKTKCDGQKPVCCNCAKRGRHECVYDLEPNQSRVAGYKQKIDQQKTTIEELQSEVQRLKGLSQQPANFDTSLPSPYRSTQNNGGGVSIQFLMNPAPELHGSSSTDHNPGRQEAVAFDRAESLKRPRTDREAELLSQQRDLELENRTLKELMLLLSSIEDREVVRQMADEIGHNGVSDDLLVRAQHLLSSQMMRPLDNRTPSSSRLKRPASTGLPNRLQSNHFRGHIDPSL